MVGASWAGLQRRNKGKDGKVSTSCFTALGPAGGPIRQTNSVQQTPRDGSTSPARPTGRGGDEGLTLAQEEGSGGLRHRGATRTPTFTQSEEKQNKRTKCFPLTTKYMWNWNKFFTFMSDHWSLQSSFSGNRGFESVVDFLTKLSGSKNLLGDLSCLKRLVINPPTLVLSGETDEFLCVLETVSATPTLLSSCEANTRQTWPLPTSCYVWTSRPSCELKHWVVHNRL